MLPPELTRARKREGKLSLSPLSPAERARAEELCRALVAVTQASLGQPRDEVEAGWAAVTVAPKERKLLLGLTHLLEQKSEFTSPASAEPEAVRRALFGRAAERRASLCEGEHLDRDALVAEVAAELALSPEQLEQALYADLRSAQRLERCALTNPEAAVSEYELLQVQSVLLRAVSVEAEVRAAKPDAYRALFRKLKFRQLLHRIEPLDEPASGRPSGYRLEIDGPMSLFGPTTKYGLELALSLPALLSCGSLRLKAELRWGKRREKLHFEQLYTQPPALAAADAGVRTEVLELCEAIGASKTGFSARLSEELLVLAEGGGVLVPDLELCHAERSGSVLVELLGFWSRDAVFQRIEAAERGLQRPILFVVSSRLRVSEELLEGDPSASLYVYKGKINAHALLRKVDQLLSHGHPGQAPAR
jgi:predicted nuclease of restriction endonuclease-like RecB superfamily